MKLDRAYSLRELSELLDCKSLGNDTILAHGLNEIHVVQEGDIAFVDHPKYYEPTLKSAASIVIIDQEVDVPDGKALLVHPEPFTAFNTLIKHFSARSDFSERIHPTAKIASTAAVHPTASIGAHATVGEHSVIGASVCIGHDCSVGNDVIIHANTTIGGDAFYYKNRGDKFEKLLSCGGVIINDHVEIGAGCTIDRGATNDTIIGEQTKLDNQVHIGHDVVIGKHCLLAAQVGIAGCVTIEDDVTIWGQVGCIANVTIGKGATIMAQSGVGKSLEPGKTYFGSPAGEARKKLKELAQLSRLANSSE